MEIIEEDVIQEAFGTEFKAKGSFVGYK